METHIRNDRDNPSMATVGHPKLCVAIASNSEPQRIRLESMLDKSSLQVVVNQAANDKFFGLINRKHADVLLIDLDKEMNKQSGFLDKLLERSNLPVLFNDSASTPASAADTSSSHYGKALTHKLISLVKESSSKQKEIALMSSVVPIHESYRQHLTPNEPAPGEESHPMEESVAPIPKEIAESMAQAEEQVEAKHPSAEPAPVAHITAMEESVAPIPKEIAESMAQAEEQVEAKHPSAATVGHPKLCVAIASNSEPQRIRLESMLDKSSLQVVVNQAANDKFFDLINRKHADVLLIDLDEEMNEQSGFLDKLLERSNLPVLFNDSASTPASAADTSSSHYGKALTHKLKEIALMSSVIPIHESYRQHLTPNEPAPDEESHPMEESVAPIPKEIAESMAQAEEQVEAKHPSAEPAPVAHTTAKDAPDAYGLLNGEPNVMATPSQTSEQPVQRLSFAYAKRHGVMTAGMENGRVRVLCRPGTSVTTLAELRRLLAHPLKLETVPANEFESVLQRNYESGTSEAMQMMGGLGEDMDLFSLANQLPAVEDLLESEDDAPIIRLINALLTEAVKENASDIHIEPFEERLVVRFRVDGVLREIIEPKRMMAPLLVSRIKVMAKLDIAEKRLPQDGRISLRIAGRAVDVRVSTLPSGHGERVVLRLLDKQAGRLTLENLGMPSATQAVMDKVIHMPHGIVLVTGPTGSGKTTTLYAALTRLNDKSRNLMTVEDPIEYFLDGVGQTLVNTKVDMTFARGLRAILRQDPDVVMVGEIRDLETAQIAVQASLTGHMVLSTLHTNSAVGAVTRLRDMGVEPFLVASSLVGVLAQRLVRILCSHCKRPYTASSFDCDILGKAHGEPPTLYAPMGCSHCNNLGYRGRTGIYELIPVDDKMRNMIHEGTGEHELESYARNLSVSIREDGLRRVLAGDTSLEEVLRVTRED